jgi:hypothetical protein
MTLSWRKSEIKNYGAWANDKDTLNVYSLSPFDWFTGVTMAENPLLGCFPAMELQSPLRDVMMIDQIRVFAKAAAAGQSRTDSEDAGKIP